MLEIGTGSGYQAAVLAAFASHVYSIEIVELLGRRAASTLENLGYSNVTARAGDGYAGWLEELSENRGPQIDPYEAYLMQTLVAVRELLRNRQPLPLHRFMATRPDGR